MKTVLVPTFALFYLGIAGLPVATHAQVLERDALCVAVESTDKSIKNAAIIQDVIKGRFSQVLQLDMGKIEVKLKKQKSTPETVKVPIDYLVTNSNSPVITLEPPNVEGKFGGAIELESLLPCKATVKYKATVVVQTDDGSKKFNALAEFEAPGRYKLKK